MTMEHQRSHRGVEHTRSKGSIEHTRSKGSQEHSSVFSSMVEHHMSKRSSLSFGSSWVEGLHSDDSVENALKKLQLPRRGSWPKGKPSESSSPTLRSEGLLEGLGEGQARMERQLRDIRGELSRIQSLLWTGGGGGGRSQWWRELFPSEESPVAQEQPSTGPASPLKVPVATRGLVPASWTKSSRRSQGSVTNSWQKDLPATLEESEEPRLLPVSLPENWPSCLVARQVALAETAHVSPTSTLSGLLSQKTMALDSTTNPDESKSKWVIDPNGGLCLALALVTLIVLCHDMFMIPFVLAWELTLQGPVLVLAWTSCCYWTVDMCLGFIMGYHKGQEVELRLRRLVRHYAGTWFVPDLVVVLSDWFSLIVALYNGGPGNVSKLLRFAKLGKLVRLLGLLRSARVVQIFEEFIEQSLSDQTRVALRLLQFFLGTTWLCHLLCCCWFAVGRIESDTGMRWTHVKVEQGEIELPFMEASMLYQYVTALHWSLAQFSLGAIEITCFNTWERLFNMVCMFVGLICGSVIVGALSATMMDYQMMRKENAQKLSKLRLYLRENRRCINKHTALLVQQQASERLKVKERIQERDVQILQLVSSTLRSELRFQIFQSMLSGHGLFQLWATLDRTTMRRVCVEFIEYVHYRPHDEVFLAGTMSGRAYHVSGGNMLYIKDPDTAPVAETEMSAVPAGGWMAEASLWAQWIHVGTARTEGHCDVLHVTATAVDMMVEHHPQVGSITKHYAKQFMKCLLAAQPPYSDYPDDLEVPHTQFDEIVMSCNPAVQRVVSLHLLQNTGRVLKSLETEIRQGKSCVVLTREGKIQRMVSVVVLELTDNADRVLVEVAKAEDAGEGRTHFRASCQLPAKKQSQGEVSLDTLGRIVGSLRFGGKEPLAGLEMQGLERQTQTSHSMQFGVDSKYCRKIYSASTKDTEAFGIRLPSIGGGSGEPDGDVELVHKASAHSAPIRGTTSIVVRLSNKGELYLEDIQVVIDNDKRYLLAWLSRDLFEHLRTPVGQRSLKAWVEALNEVNLGALGLGTPDGGASICTPETSVTLKRSAFAEGHGGVRSECSSPDRGEQ